MLVFLSYSERLRNVGCIEVTGTGAWAVGELGCPSAESVRICRTLVWERTERETHQMSGALSEGFSPEITTVTTGSLGKTGLIHLKMSSPS